jgi:hypothetical protein
VIRGFSLDEMIYEYKSAVGTNGARFYLSAFEFCSREYRTTRTELSLRLGWPSVSDDNTAATDA